jgi:hypothetical protein
VPVFEQAFKNIDDVLWKEAGCTTELDYTEQTSWLLFLKYLDGLEQDLADEAALGGKKYAYILDKPYRWDTWAAPKGKDGTLDHNKALTGDDLRDFVNQKLFPYLQGFTQKATGPNTIEYKIGQIFGEIKNKISSGYNMREIIDQIDGLRFRSQAEKHELSHLYEAKIRNMGNAGRNGGEYYTPRPLIRAMVHVLLCESYEYLKQTYPKRTTAQDRLLQQRTFYGKEKKSLAYPITPGRIEGLGRRGSPLFADYVLVYRNRTLAVSEAKAWDKPLTEGLGQAKNYAAKMAVRFAYATNGQGIYGIDMETGKEGELARYPAPEDLWALTFAEVTLGMAATSFINCSTSEYASRFNLASSRDVMTALSRFSFLGEGTPPAKLVPNNSSSFHRDQQKWAILFRVLRKAVTRLLTSTISAKTISATSR